MNNKTSLLAQSALLTCLIAICSQIQIPLPLVPINAALLAIHCTGIILKPKYALLTTSIYIFLGFIGLPVFANFSGGAQIVFGATGGYIVGYILDALIISIGLEKCKSSNLTILILCCLGTLTCYLFGTLWFIIVTESNILLALTYCVLPFIPGDLIKIFIATLLSKRILLKKRIS